MGYPGDLTDAQWQLMVPLPLVYVPGRWGRPRIWSARRIVEAIGYVDRTDTLAVPADRRR